MPPKKKAKGKVKKIKKNPDRGDELEQKYKRSVLDVEVLKEHLVLRREVARQAQANSEELKSRMKELEQKLHEEREDKRDINADLTRQYKSMKTDLEVKVQKLDAEVTTLRKQLVQCQEELKLEREARQNVEQEKDASISDLQSQLANMEAGYQRILHDSLDSLLSHLADARLRWEEESTAIHLEHKELLASFGLKPLHL
ncbi:hypothetical protein AGOR_G00127150 [Albula goreensis]|uniref:Dynein regulatory complex protein 12 n=1 Tax=Albula goreensis TaxID=1534307 RepID=A0A8T3DBX4_9TELE|nr:hypothetical protein AGOR_G00127150 [Albula goreensis]